MGEIKINKKAFIEAIDSIEQQFDHDKNCANAFSVILPNDHVSLYDNSSIVEGFINLLQKLTNDVVDDTDKYSWIEYFIYELKFGEKYEEGMVTFYDENVKLKTASDLFALLLRNNNI
jgi:hypothetical protein